MLNLNDNRALAQNYQSEERQSDPSQHQMHIMGIKDTVLTPGFSLGIKKTPGNFPGCGAAGLGDRRFIKNPELARNAARQNPGKTRRLEKT